MRTFPFQCYEPLAIVDGTLPPTSPFLYLQVPIQYSKVNIPFWRRFRNGQSILFLLFFLLHDLLS